MRALGNRKLWVIGIIACLGLFFELVTMVGVFNTSSVPNLYHNVFRWNVVCAALAPIALVLGATVDRQRLRISTILAFFAATGPLSVFLLMQPTNPVYCFIQSYRKSPTETLGGFTLVFAPLVFMAAFFVTLYQRSRSNTLTSPI
jgi:hypothetical protein